MFCANCGNKLDEGIQFCANCGAKITNGVSIQAKQREVLPVAEPIKPAVQVSIPQTNSLPAGKKLSVLALISIIFLSVSSFLLVGVLYTGLLNGRLILYFPLFGQIRIPLRNLLTLTNGWLIIQLAYYIFSIIVAMKTRKIIGKGILLTIIILFGICALINLIPLFLINVL